jgi:hypothetical protein
MDLKEGEVKLKRGEQYELTDIAVTSDNKLLLCNRQSSHVYIYKDYKTYAGMFVICFRKVKNS